MAALVQVKNKNEKRKQESHAYAPGRDTVVTGVK